MAERIYPAAPIVGRGGLTPTPFQFVFTGEDHLRLVVANAVPDVVVSVQGRFLDDGGSSPSAFTFQFKPPSTGAVSTSMIAMGRGVLLNVAIRALDQRTEPGECYARLDVVRGFSGGLTLLGVLVCGYIESSFWRAWPGSVLDPPSFGRGRVRLVTVANPAPGAAVVIPITDTQTRWRVIAVFCAFTASAVAGNRVVFCSLIQSSTEVYRSASSLVATANFSNAHAWGAGAPSPSVAAITSGLGGLPVDCTLSSRGASDASIQIMVGGMDPADQISLVRALVEEWRNPVTAEP